MREGGLDYWKSYYDTGFCLLENITLLPLKSHEDQVHKQTHIA